MPTPSVPGTRLLGPDANTWLVVNPAARRGAVAFAEARAWLKAAVRLSGAFMPTSLEAMTALLRRAVDVGVERVVVGGGDGTLSHAAQVLQQTPVAMGVLPLGTGNTFAWGLGLGPRWHHWLEVIRQGWAVPMDLGEAEASGERRVFLNSATIGVSEALVELLSQEAKRRLGWWAWPLAFRRALKATPAIAVRLGRADGEDRFVTRQLVVANGRTVAGPIPTSPLASPWDGWLDVFCLGGPSEGEILCATVRVLTGHHVRAAASHYQRARTLTLEAEPPARLDVDGELWRLTPVRFSVKPRALWVVAPVSPEAPQGRSALHLFVPPPRPGHALRA
ncbi:MAG: diacylglycerol kinase [Firmicutes bacterium]|nr:diacylglycerol kinase [Alicyclobacillaceae bacterium]MCL6496835.1 diacylglycerol kinase [Bacillota bacterium]